MKHAPRDGVLDLDAGTVHIDATLVRVNGAGLQIQPRTKTAGSERIPHLPPHLVRLLTRQRSTGRPPGPAGATVTSSTRVTRDPTNIQADPVPGTRPCPLPVGQQPRLPHDRRLPPQRRRLPIRHIADRLGHTRRSTTMDYYLGRRAPTTNCTDALDPPLTGN